MSDAIRFLKEKIGFLCSFALAKGVVFLAPLLVAEILSKDDFGILEYALAGLGMLLNTFVNAGVPAAYPYFKLKEKEIQVHNAFDLHYIWLFTFFVVTQISYITIGFSIHYYIALNVAYIISNQIFISTQLKTNEKISFAVYIDSGVYIILLLFYISSYFGIIKPEIYKLSQIIFCYALIYGLLALSKLKVLATPNLLANYKKILSYSIHVLIGGLLIYFITVSGRILIEYFIKDFEKVGVYAYYWRLSAVVVMFYQVINIAFFKKMYTINPKTLDTYFALCFLVLTVISVIGFCSTPLFMSEFSTYFASTIVEYRLIYFLLSIQMIFWIATALLSNIIDREKLAFRNNPLFIGLLMVFITVLFILKDSLTLEIFTLTHMIVVFIAALIQIITLSKKKIFFTKSFLSLIAVMTLGVLGYLTML
mgnify:CR=1 FL=1